MADFQVEDIEYEHPAGTHLLARVYRPRGTGPFPAALEVHGGAWTSGDRLNNVAIAEALAGAGVVVASIDFRMPPEVVYPTVVADVNLGVRWLKANAGKYNGKAQVGAMGVSSGGHLVALAGVRPNDARYSALPGPQGVDASLSFVVPCWPVIDPLYRYNHFKAKGDRQEVLDAHHAYFGTEAAMTEAAPRTAVESDASPSLPPVLMVLKEGDDTHPLPMQEAFINAYRAKSGPIELFMFKTATSAPGLKPDEPEWGRVIETITEFARRFG